MKPTYGVVSRYGLIAFASSLDQIGPFATTVADAALGLEVIAGHDPMDSTSLDGPRPALLESLDDGVAGLRVGIVEDFLAEAPRESRRGRTRPARCWRRPAPRSTRSRSPSCCSGCPPTTSSPRPRRPRTSSRYDGVRYGLRVDGRDVGAR